MAFPPIQFQMKWSLMSTKNIGSLRLNDCKSRQAASKLLK